MKRIAKRHRDKFRDGAVALLERFGARPSETVRDWRLDTRIGPLYITVYANSDVSLGWLACVFPELDRATADRIGANPYSGKWNHHYDRCAVDDALRDIERQLRWVCETIDSGRKVPAEVAA